MKYILIISGIICFVFLKLINPNQGKSSSLTKKEAPVLQSYIPQKIGSEAKKPNDNQLVLAELADIEGEYSNFATKEIIKKLSSLELNAEKKRFFSLANENTLSQEIKKELVSHMRLKQALNKIILERALRNTEENFL